MRPQEKAWEGANELFMKLAPGRMTGCELAPNGGPRESLINQSYLRGTRVPDVARQC